MHRETCRKIKAMFCMMTLVGAHMGHVRHLVASVGIASSTATFAGRVADSGFVRGPVLRRLTFQEQATPIDLNGQPLHNSEYAGSRSVKAVADRIVETIASRGRLGGWRIASPWRRHVDGLDTTALGKRGPSKSSHDALARGTRSGEISIGAPEHGQDGGAGMLTSTANIVKTVVGSGILSLSWSFYYASLLPAVFFSVVMAFGAAMNFYLLGICSERTGQSSYGAVWSKIFGERGGLLQDALIALTCFSSCVSCLIIAGDYIPIAMKGLGVTWAPLQHRRIATALVFAFVFPLNFLKDLSMLGTTSIIGTLGALYTFGMLSVESVKAGFDASDWEAFSLSPGLVMLFPGLAGALDGHFNAPQVYQELQNRSPQRWATVTTCAFAAIMLITLGCGVSGYMMFGSKVPSNVLKAPSLHRLLSAMLAYVATSLSVIFGFPLYLQCFRETMESALLKFSPSKISQALAQMNPDHRRHSLSALCLALTLATALSTDRLGIVNTLSGAMCDSLIAFVFPSLMYLKLTEEDRSRHSRLSRVLPWLSIGGGVAFGVTGTVASILDVCSVKIPAR